MGSPRPSRAILFNQKIDLDEALKWADLSIQNEERFENLTTKADMLRALNRQDEAKKIWDQALAKATALGRIRMVASCRIRKKAPKQWKS